MSPYGAFDMAGEVDQWTEDLGVSSFRGIDGGSFFYTASPTQSSSHAHDSPGVEASNIGFRVASIPEPSTGSPVALAGIGIVGLVWSRRRSAMRVSKEPAPE